MASTHGILTDAWRLVRGDTDLVLRVAAPFLFLPAFAVHLLVPPPPGLPDGPRDQAAMQAWAQALTEWGGSNAGWYVAADAAGVFGLATLTLMILARPQPDVAGALAGAGGRIVRFLLASLLVAMPVGMGLWLFVLPGLYAQARLAAVLPVLVGEAPTAAGRSLARSWRLTRADGFAILGAVIVLFAAQYLVLAPLLSANDALRAPGQENPLVRALVAAGIAAAGAAYHVAVLLVGIVAYRRAASDGI